jgi:hypothetical protein
MPALDPLLARSATAAARRATGTPTLHARIHGVAVSTGSRRLNGLTVNGPYFKALELTRDLARHPKGDPYALLTEQRIVLERERLTPAKTEALRRRWHELTETLDRLEAERRGAERQGDLARLREVDAAVGADETALTQAAVDGSCAYPRM